MDTDEDGGDERRTETGGETTGTRLSDYFRQMSPLEEFFLVKPRAKLPDEARAMPWRRCTRSRPQLSYQTRAVA